MTDIAIFPIPECVTFPKTTVPLHVFEPRYRSMIHHCLDNELLLGITHTQKMLSEAKPSESLACNLATYKPFTVFSAGVCTLIEAADDGRLFCEVAMIERYKMIEERQKLPFMIYQCEPYPDKNDPAENISELELLKEKVTKRVLAITCDQADMQMLLRSREWTTKSAEDLSIELFTIIRFNPDTQQDILEMTSPIKRMNALLNLLS